MLNLYAKKENKVQETIDKAEELRQVTLASIPKTTCTGKKNMFCIKLQNLGTVKLADNSSFQINLENWNGAKSRETGIFSFSIKLRKFTTRLGIGTCYAPIVDNDGNLDMSSVMETHEDTDFSSYTFQSVDELIALKNLFHDKKFLKNLEELKQMEEAAKECGQEEQGE